MVHTAVMPTTPTECRGHPEPTVVQGPPSPVHWCYKQEIRTHPRVPYYFSVQSIWVTWLAWVCHTDWGKTEGRGGGGWGGRRRIVSGALRDTVYFVTEISKLGTLTLPVLTWSSIPFKPLVVDPFPLASHTNLCYSWLKMEAQAPLWVTGQETAESTKAQSMWHCVSRSPLPWI